MRAREKRNPKKEIKIVVSVDQPSDYYFDKCTDLLLQYPTRQKDPEFIKEYVIAVAQWRMSTLGLDEMELTFRKLSGLACAYHQNVDIDIRALKKCKNPTIFTNVTDAIIHEVEHLRINKQNKSIKKDANGNLSHPYIPPHYGYVVTKTLERACNTDYFSAGDWAIGMYCINPDEVLARKAGHDYSIELYNAVKGINPEFDQRLREFIGIEERRFKTTPSDFLDYVNNYKMLQDVIHRDVYQYQYTYVRENCPEKERAWFDMARQIEPNQEAAHMAFSYYMSTNQPQMAIDLLNSPTFKNNPFEVQSAVSTLMKKNIPPTLMLTSFEPETLQPFIDQYNYSAPPAYQAPTVEYVAVLPVQNQPVISQ